MAKPTLTYFDFPGRAEAIRLAFAIRDVDFVDNRVSMEKFASEVKATLPNQTLPHLADGDLYLNTSIAILLHAGKLGQLVPSDPVKLAVLMDLLCSIEDVYIHVSKIVCSATDEEKKKNKAALGAKANVALSGLEKFIQYNGKDGHTVGDSLTVGDLQVYAAVATLKTGAISDEVLKAVEASTVVMAVYKKVSEHPKVKAYYKK